MKKNAKPPKAAKASKATEAEVVKAEALPLDEYATSIAAVLAEPAKEMSWDEKQHAILDLLQKALAATGKLFLVAGLPGHVNADGEITQLVPGNADFDRFLDGCGLLPGAGDWDKLLFRKLASRRDLPANFVHTIAHFDAAETVLYLNQWDGKFLRLADEVTEHRVGEFDVLFSKGDEPHEPLDLDAINRYQGPALDWDEDSALVQNVFSVGNFSESAGIGRENSISVMLYFAMAALFQERVMVVPVVALNGVSGTRKSALCVALGWIISGAGMKFRSTSCPEGKAELENALINAEGLLVLDEANSMRDLQSLLKSVLTGGELKRRVLFTTSAQARFPIDALLMLTANMDSATEESMVKRSLRITMGDPEASGKGWRGDFNVREEWRRGGIRQKCWRELVCRALVTLRCLRAAETKKQADIRVPNRMSGFWSFIAAVAKQEGPEVEKRIEAAMQAITEEGRSSVANADDILPLLMQWLDEPAAKRGPKEPDPRGLKFTAGEIGANLISRFESDVRCGAPTPPISRQVKEILQSSLRLSNKLAGSQEYRRLLGMQVHRGRFGKMFSFNPPTPRPDPPKPPAKGTTV